MSCQSLPITGFRLTTLLNQYMHAAVLFKNLNEALLAAGGASAFANSINPDNTWTDQNGVLVAPEPLGQTKGGVTIIPGMKFELMELDSAFVPVQGMEINTEARPRITVNGLTELGDADIFAMFLGAADVTVTNGMQKVQPRINVCDSDYFGNIAAVGQISRDGSYLVSVLRGAFIQESGEIATTKGNNAAPAVTWLGHAPQNATMVVPMSHYVPVYGS